MDGKVELGQSVGRNLTRREFLKLAGVAASEAAGLSLFWARQRMERNELQFYPEVPFIISENWLPEEKVSIVQGLSFIRGVLLDNFGIQGFLPKGKEGIMVDKDVKKVIPGGLGGYFYADEFRILLPEISPGDSIVIPWTLPHEVVHALGSVCVPRGGGRYGGLLTEGPAEWMTRKTYSQYTQEKVDEFEVIMRYPAKELLQWSKGEVRRWLHGKIDKTVAVGNVWSYFEEQANSGLAKHLRQRYFEECPEGNEAAIQKFWQWGNEIWPLFSETMQNSAICSASFS